MKVSKVSKKNKHQKINHNFDWITFINSLVLLLIPITIGFADGQSAIANEKIKSHTFVLFQPPPEEEQPEETEGAASRQNGKCSGDLFAAQQDSADVSHKLTAIVPDRNYGLTTVERPNLWVYLPQTSAQQAILSIKEAGTRPHWQQSIDLTGEAGIMKIKLAQDAPALKIGQNYQWAVILVCGNQPTPNDPVVAAWIERISKSQITTINKQQVDSTKLDKAAWYARQGIWYDALNILASEKSSLNNGNDLWGKYLQSGGLAKFANQPIIDY